MRSGFFWGGRFFYRSIFVRPPFIFFSGPKQKNVILLSLLCLKHEEGSAASARAPQTIIHDGSCARKRVKKNHRPRKLNTPSTNSIAAVNTTIVSKTVFLFHPEERGLSFNQTLFLLSFLNGNWRGTETPFYVHRLLQSTFLALFFPPRSFSKR